MPRQISPADDLILVTGINADSFRPGYDNASGVWDKSLCHMQQPDRISVMILEPYVYQEAVLKCREITYGQGERKAEWGSFDGMEYFREAALWWTSYYAYSNAIRYGGDKLILVMLHPACRLAAVDYNIEGTSDPDQLFVQPARARLERIMRLTSHTMFEGVPATRSLRLEDITGAFR